MNECLISNWNDIVSKEDLVWVLGDFTLSRNVLRIKYFLDRLNGTKKLIKGNHDTLSIAKYVEAGFAAVYDHPIIIGGFVILSHEPIFVNENTPYYNYYGHVHDDMNFLTETPRSRCVSVERTKYGPVRFILNKKA